MTTTWNPSDKNSGVTLSGGNLVATIVVSGNQGVRGIDRVYSGQYYWEITFTTSSNLLVGLCLGTTDLTLLASGLAGNTSVLCNQVGSVQFLGSAASILLGTIVNGGILCIALDATADLVWFRNGAAGNWNNSAPANPATGVGGLNIARLSGGPMGLYPVAFGPANGGVVTANFGASAFAGTVPSGFTSGFPSGTTLVNSAVVSQLGVEHWGPGAPAAQVTQTALEVWGGITAGARSALVTQLAVEQWAPVAVPPPTARQYSVTVNSS